MSSLSQILYTTRLTSIQKLTFAYIITKSLPVYYSPKLANQLSSKTLLNVSVYLTPSGFLCRLSAQLIVSLISAHGKKLKDNLGLREEKLDLWQFPLMPSTPSTGPRVALFHYLMELMPILIELI